MRQGAVGLVVVALLVAGCGDAYEHPMLVETEQEGAASTVQYVLEQALSGDVFSACPADGEGRLDVQCIDLVRTARDLEVSSARVAVDADLVQVSEDGQRVTVPRGAITLPAQASSWLRDDVQFTVAEGRVEIVGSSPGAWCSRRAA